MFNYLPPVIAFFMAVPAAPLVLAAPALSLALAVVNDDFDLPVAHMLPPNPQMLAAARPG